MGETFQDDIEATTREVREEVRLLETRMRRQWGKPLHERVESGRALGNLVLASTDAGRGLVHFEPPREDFAFFREGEGVRLSLDSPESDFVDAKMVGLTEKGLTFQTSETDSLAFSQRSGWSVDEGLVDLSHFYLKAIDAMGATEHGREAVCPALFGEVDNEVDFETHEAAMDELEAVEKIDDWQAEAVANCLAAERYHLVQGPPGTGKTHTLAQLVEKLVGRGERVLVTAFTHRAIHNALRKIGAVLGDACPIAKIAEPIPGDDLPFPVHSNFADSGLASVDGSYVIGATPFALWSERLAAGYFDSAVLDETSQLTVPAAAMAMLRADRWFFFGDHRQLPPVSLVHADNPSDASVFARLAARCEPTTLNTTYRLNDSLTEWPSESFYSGELVSAEPVAPHRLALKSSPTRYPDLLASEPSLLRVELGHAGDRSRSNDEADLAADLVLELLRCGLGGDEVGVVVPFRAQASRVRTLLRGARFGGFETAAREVTVDTVERFQGQEREVVIYSFTTSDRTFAERLGDFLFQAQRLNVAVTRARTKVVLLHSAELREFAEAVRSRSEAADVFMTLLDAAEPIELAG